MEANQDPYRRYVEAAMDLLVAPGEWPARDAVRIVCGDELREMWQTANVLSTASETTDGMPRTGAGLGPRRLIVFRHTPPGSDRPFDVHADCALWAKDYDAPLLVVSHRDDCHFALGTDGLVQHSGMPAGDLGAGLELATRRLRDAAAVPGGFREPADGQGATVGVDMSGLIDDEELDPDYRLELLSASDPKARASMMRHTVALRFMLAGRLHDRDVAHILIGADFQTTLEGVERYKALTGADGNDRIMIGFEVDDPTGPPASFGLWHFRNGITTFYDQCIPWLPPTGNRAWLIGQNATEVMVFRHEPGLNLIGTPGKPARDPWPGINRAKAKLAKLVTTPAVRNAVGDVHMRIVPSGREPVMLTLPTDPLGDG